MNKLGFTLGFLLCLSLLLMGCGSPEAEPDSSSQAEKQIAQVSDSFYSQLSHEDQALVARIQERGRLGFAVRQGQDSYQIDDQGNIRGFDYHLALAFAQALSLPAEFVVIEQVSDFYADQEGFDPAVINDDSIRYHPRLFSQVDVLAGPLGINPWRLRLSRMVAMHPASISIMGPNASQITEKSKLDGKTIPIRPGDFMHSLLLNIMEQEQIQIEFLPFDQENPVEMTLTGQADLAVDGSMFLARSVDLIKQVEVSPLRLSIVPVAWAVQLDDLDLYRILGLFISHSLETRLYHEIWSREMGIDFDLYLSIAGDLL